MGHLKVRGIILRLVNFKDYDRYLTVLTRDLGVISIYARRIRSAKNTFGQRCQLFSFADFTVFENKGRYSLNEVETVYTFGRLREDVLALTGAAQLAEIILDSVPEAQDQRFYELFLRACHELDRDEKLVYRTTWLAEMKLMHLLGYQPLLGRCRICDTSPEYAEEVYFDYRHAAVYCPMHGAPRLNEIVPTTGRISLALYRLLQYLEQAPIERTFAVQLEPALVDELGHFTLRYVDERLDRTYNKFTFFQDFGLPPKAP